LAQIFFRYLFKNKIILILWKLWLKPKVRQLIFFSTPLSLLLLLDPESGIRCKHPGSATHWSDCPSLRVYSNQDMVGATTEWPRYRCPPCRPGSRSAWTGRAQSHVAHRTLWNNAKKYPDLFREWSFLLNSEHGNVVKHFRDTEKGIFVSNLSQSLNKKNAYPVTS